MTRFLPLFPLNLVVFPGEKLNLHIFEPRYKQLISECVAGQTTFGIPSFINNKISVIGTEIKIIEIEKTYPNGEMDVKTKGMGLFRILDFFKLAPNKFYPAGTVENIPIDLSENVLLKEKINDCLHQLYSILSLQKLLIRNPENYRIFDIAHHIGLNMEQEYALLACKTEKERQEMVLEHLLKILPVLLQTEKLKDRVKMNGHFKNETPPNF